MAAPKKKSSTKKQASSAKSFVKAAPTTPFFTFRFTQQTVYWMIVGILILALGIWVMALTMRVQSLYDDIDAANLNNNTVIVPKHKK